jgi:hypothetical protein
LCLRKQTEKDHFGKRLIEKYASVCRHHTRNKLSISFFNVFHLKLPGTRKQVNAKEKQILIEANFFSMFKI